MTNRSKIPIKNIYYMLCYAWNIIDYADSIVIGEEEFDNIYNLLTRMLSKEVNTLIKRGFHRNYIEKTESTSKLKGTIQITQSINQMTHMKKQMVCTYDNYSSNVLFNQIIKSTMIDLMRYPQLDIKLKKKLRNLLVYFNDVNYIEVNRGHFSLLRFNRNNLNYQIIINICRLINLELIANLKDGSVKFNHYVKEKRMSEIYENFLKNFYDIHTNYQVRSRHYNWFLSPLDESNVGLLPRMETDIELEIDVDTKIIIDAKYYQKALSNRFEQEKFISVNMYQLNAYLAHNKEYKNLRGILIYPSVGYHFNERYERKDKYTIEFHTVDLSKDWMDIKNELLNIIQ